MNEQVSYSFSFPGATGVKLPNHDLRSAKQYTAHCTLLIISVSAIHGLSPWWATPLGAVPLTPRGALFVPREIVSGSTLHSIV